IGALFAGRELTATEAAEIAGLSPSATSYHLRALAKWGIVVPADAGQDGRERRWKAAGRSLTVNPDDPVVSAAATSLIAGRTLSELTHDALSSIGRMAEEGPAWREASTVGQTVIYLTADEARELSRRVLELMDSYPDRTPSQHPSDTRPVRMAHVLVPLDHPA
ncbi:MAG: ArsR family transcriptional regulator, partial [Nakamurella sp.]